MQAFWPLDDIETNGLSCFQGFVAIHFNGRVMGKQIFVLAVLVDESIPFGIVEPLDLAACHAHIPLQQTPSLEYHPVHQHSNPEIGLTVRTFITHCGPYWL